MKKLMIAAAIVCAAVISQAATWNWAAVTGSLWDAKGNATAGGAAITSGASAYLFVITDTFDQSDLVAELRKGTSLADAFAANGVKNAPITPIDSDGQFAKSANFEFGDATTTYTYFIAAIAPSSVADAVFISDIVSAKGSAQPGDAVSLMIPSMTKQSRLAVNTGDYSVSGWYSTVPEPTSGLLLLLGVAGLALRRRRA